ncbi:MAG: hypothetical protein JWO80_3733, partial [Bryobacterales bacterium]|nr:hypothetical protein [Bryobacterales bacterium]
MGTNRDVLSLILELPPVICMSKSVPLLLSLVIPIYNEAQVIPLLLCSLRETLAQRTEFWEIIFVNDGSCDLSLQLLSEAAIDPRIKILSFARNFGHQTAITAGMDFAEGDAVVVMDADLQDPPEILHEMITQYYRGFDVVSAQRLTRQGETVFKRTSARLFYWLMRNMVDARLIPEVGDFRLFSGQAILALRSLREQHRFMRGLVAWLGLRETIVPFHRKHRVCGETKYPLYNML